MKQAQRIIGACIRALREQRGLSLEALAAKAAISYQYLSGVETGKENFSVQVLESLARALDVQVQVLIIAAYEGIAQASVPRLEARFFRPSTPLPLGLKIQHIDAAANLAQSIIYRINRNLRQEIGQPLQALIQGNNFSGLVSNVLTNAFDQCSPYKHNHDQRYPDLIYAEGAPGGVGLEVKTTINVGKGGESHNGHGGWHLVGCYRFLETGDIQFIHLMFAQLNGHQHEQPDWSYLGSRVNATTGSRRTETYTTTLTGTTKLRDGSVYLDTRSVNPSRWRQARDGEIPAWSIFAE
ncbi:helix-turn-helix domain-containing protein [Rhabdochromatium marinum]|uniref:helix-turn-helix domain-containing protein n=1 Tax=Rhabdochromatium marinum TaxID=48729 RepID=UPI001908EB1A|nr:helix-turn-helix transcriptional regulator [Rhabdochromatium marinum]MBK1648984.1 hypothetical protein [Rhabdochromatium marinum]